MLCDAVTAFFNSLSVQFLLLTVAVYLNRVDIEKMCIYLYP